MGGNDRHGRPAPPEKPPPPAEAIPLAARWLAGAGSIAILTGAGVSAESGVPTFRGAGGLWRHHRAEELATAAAFARDPAFVWEWYRYRQGIVGGAEPNAAHEALARLEKRTPELTLITQNVDGLHRRAGSRRVVELHGNLFRARCEGDGETRLLTGREEETVPRCRCGRAMRPDVVWFGEPLPPGAIAGAERASREARLFLVIGTSAVVEPAASLPLIAREGGGRIVEINPAATVLTPLADLSIRGGAAETVPAIVAAAFPSSGSG